MIVASALRTEAAWSSLLERITIALRLRRHRWLAPVLAWLATAGFNIVTLAMKGTWDGHAVAMQWWTAVDNVIPEQTARWMLGEQSFIPGVYPFDRGPLQPILLMWGGEWSTRPLPALLTGVVINSTWVLGLWVLLRALRVTERRIAYVVFLVALTGPVWMNTIYVWPKMLAAALCLGCAAMILRRQPVWAGVLAGLALLAHGTALVALIALLPWAVSRLRWRALWVYGLAVLFYLPWFAASLVVQVTGQPQMIQWHYGGTDVDKPDVRNPVVSVLDSYRHVGWSWFEYKLNNFRIVLGDPTTWVGDAPGWPTSGWPNTTGAGGYLRWLMTGRVLLAPGILLVGLIGIRHVPRTLIWMAVSFATVYGLMEWGGSANNSAYLHTAPFALLIAWTAICALGARWWMAFLQAGVFIGLWLLAPPVWL